jgi:hypothetical protein
MTPPDRRPAQAVIVGLGVLALVALPAIATAFFALGSFRWSEPPEPSVGALWAAITLILLSLPVAVGLVTARQKSPRSSAQSPRGWLIPALAGSVLIAAWRLTRVI